MIKVRKTVKKTVLDNVLISLVAIKSRADMEPSRKRQRMDTSIYNNCNIVNYPNQLSNTTTTQSSDMYMNKDRFMVHPLSGFINEDDEETNLDIAKNIVDFFNAWDKTGKYTAIVSNKRIRVAAGYTEGKYRYDNKKKFRGKYIAVWKQDGGEPFQKVIKKEYVKACLEGLIENYDDVEDVREAMNDVFGESWAVVKASSKAKCKAYFTSTAYNFHAKIDGKYWKVWRQGV